MVIDDDDDTNQRVRTKWKLFLAMLSLAQENIQQQQGVCDEDADTIKLIWEHMNDMEIELQERNPGMYGYCDLLRKVLQQYAQRFIGCFVHMVRKFVSQRYLLS